MPKCFECGTAIREDHNFCRDCFSILKKSGAIGQCECNDWSYMDLPCFCDIWFMQCRACGRWHDENDQCICELETEKNKQKTYQKKSLSSDPEKVFFKKLEQAVDTENYRVERQVPLRQLVERTRDKWKYSNELHRYIDFCISRNNNLEPLLFIEYDDPSHERPNRQKRDIQVDEIVKEAGYEIIHIEYNNDITVDYLKGKLENYLQ